MSRSIKEQELIDEFNDIWELKFSSDTNTWLVKKFGNIIYESYKYEEAENYYNRQYARYRKLNGFTTF